MLNLVIRTLQIMVFFCLGAAAKSGGEYWLETVKLSPVTRAVFVGLQFLILFDFCRELLELMWGNGNVQARTSRHRGRPRKELASLLPRLDLQKMFDKAKARLRRRKEGE